MVARERLTSQPGGSCGLHALANRDTATTHSRDQCVALRHLEDVELHIQG
jgi:hypothetical protein